MPNQPFNVALMDVNKFIEEEQLKEVSSPLIREPSSNNFQQQGLFSESIFGEIGSPTRMTRFGYINLNCQVLHPLIFQNLKSMKSLYVEIMAGKTYAIWSEELKDFERTDVEEDPNADTGYMFFINHFKEIEWRKNTSMRRDDKIDLMINFPDLLFIDKLPVLPAGIRDIRITDGKQEKDQVNNLYMSLMNNAKAMPSNASTRPIYDSVHYAIQRKVNEIYLYIVDMMTGKKGFLEGKYGARALALGTRNVIASSNMAALSPEDPQYHKVDETKVPLFQAAKALQPLVIYNIKQFFYAGIINQSSDQIALVDPETFVLSYQTISEDAKDRMLSSEGIGEFIEEFHDADMRFQPVTVTAADNKEYYLLLVYDDGDKIYTTRDVDTFQKKFESIGRPFDRAKLRPMTRCEMLYIATWFASLDKTGTVTRYPVTDAGSVYPSKIHLISTLPARAVMMMHMNMGDWGVPIPEYPIIDATVCDALLLHPSRLGPLGGDFDGNCLVGSTRVTLRYTDRWLQSQYLADYSMSEMNVHDVLSNLEKQTFLKQDGWNYCELKMEDFPANGPYKLDRNGAKVFEIISGCEILSYKSKENIGSWEPISGITIEDDCDTVICSIAGREVEVSTNESLAVFDRNTGGMRRIAPADVTTDSLVPVFTHRPLLPELITDKQALQWLAYNGDLGTDIIPLTEDELKVVALQLPKVIGVTCLSRDILETIKYTDSLSALHARVINRGVVWASPEVGTSIRKQRVYDFLVESTKVFVVNDGVVVYDTVNWVPLFSKEANANAINHIHSLSNYVSAKGDLLVSFDDLISMTWYNLMSEPVI